MARLPDEIRSIRGMNDHIPPQSKRWRKMEQTLMQAAETFGFAPVHTPILEPTGLFSRGIGEATDIVEKEMYSFVDQLNGQSLTLRPENTASCVRAYFEQGLQRSGVQRWVYLGPMFRHERPQKGRYRQFHQMGLEIMGSDSVAADIELIVFTVFLWQQLAIPMPRLEINSLGTAKEREAHRTHLLAYWMKNESSLDEVSKARMHKNPLRLFDSKSPDMQEVIASAPILLDFLNDESKSRFAQLQKGLRVADIDFEVNPRLVRGLDYYNHTVFEWISEHLGAQATVCGGGRYDGLGRIIAGSDLAATGLAIGLERLLLLIPEYDEVAPQLSVFLGHNGGETLWQAQKIAQIVRKVNGWQAVLHYDGGKWANQIRKAVDFPCRYMMMVGESELAAQKVTIKDLKANNGIQKTLALTDLPKWLNQPKMD